MGLIVHGHGRRETRQEAYAADITYGTNNELGFDYLRDNMVVLQGAHRAARPLNFAIVDEVDSILIDEARTPLIISGPGDKSTEHVRRARTGSSPACAEAQGGEDDFSDCAMTKRRRPSTCTRARACRKAEAASSAWKT